ncbi:MAG: TIM barrel protein [Blautia sp.]|nr:TIM barrel protein [Blautia sp.]
MRLGISSSLAHGTPEEWAANHRALGCKCVVFPVSSQEEKDVIHHYAKAAAEQDLTIAEVGIWKNAIAEAEEERAEAMDYSIAQLKLADEIHAACCVNIAGAAGAKWDGGYRENFSSGTWDRTVRTIQEIIDEAKPQNTWFTVEPMPWMYPTGPEEYVKLIEAVNRERFAVHMDIINMINSPERYFFQEEFLEKCFHMLGDRIRSCHLKDVYLREEFTFQLKECACGEGTFCLERYVELAEKANPEMPMIIEHLNTDQEYIDSLNYVKKNLQRGE